MSDMVTIKIDGREITAPVGTTILKAAFDADIYIPNLCSNEELTPYGSCRLCMVELIDGKQTRLVASCIHEVTEGLAVKINTEKLLRGRRLVIELLLTRNPEHPALRKIADELGVAETRFGIDFKGCILCGQCVRTCRELVGVSAIGFKGRGYTRKVGTPFDESPPDCIACGACSYICPVQFIPREDKNGIRTIWKTDFPLSPPLHIPRHVKKFIEKFF
jgi:bidirectional [NiFe] hydrogenase diaphorase subunit